jgi:hypothetical protein
MKNSIIFPFTNPNSPKTNSEKKIKSNFTLFKRINNSLNKLTTRNPLSSKIIKVDNKFLYTSNTFYTNNTNSENDSQKKIFISTYSSINNLLNNNKSYSIKNYTNTPIKKNKTIKNIQLKKENEAKNFFGYLKNHFSIKEREKFKINLYNFILDKNKDMLTEKIKKYKSISRNIKIINEKSQFLQMMTGYICPIIEKIRHKKMNIIKKQINDEKCKEIENLLFKKRYCVSLNEKKIINYIRISNLYNQKYDNSEKNLLLKDFNKK